VVVVSRVIVAPLVALSIGLFKVCPANTRFCDKLGMMV
jgi:hypothetical protein